MNAWTWLVWSLVGASASAFQKALRGSQHRVFEPDLITANYTVTDDVFARSNRPDENYNDVTNLGVSYGEQHNDRITYVKFPIRGDVQRSPSLESAVVSMRLNQAPLVSMTMNVYLSDTENWDEGTLTWNDRPGYDQDANITAPITLTPSDHNTWIQFDVTAVFAYATRLGQDSLSLVLAADIPADLDPPSEGIKFDSKEDDRKIPYITVTYVAPPPTAAPTLVPTMAPSESMAPSDLPSMTPTIEWYQPEYAPLVSIGAGGRLAYTRYANEINYSHGSYANPGVLNTVPDFSGVGYYQGARPIPFIPVQQTLSPNEGGGDRREDIQAAIDAVAALPLDENGFRGAVLLEAGEYEISHPGLKILDSGIVLRGQGQGEFNGTLLNFTSTVRDSHAITLGRNRGGYNNIEPDGATYSVVDTFVPTGSRTISISNASTISVGDRIVIRLEPNSDWLFQMSNMAQWGWNTQSYRERWLRVVTAVRDSELTLDQPIVHPIEQVYGGAVVYRYRLDDDGADAEIQEVGVENLRIESIYASEKDEDHGKHAIMIQRVMNGWVRQTTARYFWMGLVLLRRNSYQVTVEDSAALDPKGTLSGGRRYPFQIDDGHAHLMQRCYAKDFRHTFATASHTAGPHVFVDSSAPSSFNDIGPHERFATGQLYDNIRTSIHPDDDGNGGEMNAVNRGPSGSGHGWAGVQVMFWNSIATQWRIHAANGAMSWAIGMIGPIGDRDRREPEPDGIFQSLGSFVTPRSLYYAQLQDRLGAHALHHMILPQQRRGPIWDALDEWAGDGLFGDAVVAFFDGAIAPVVDVPVRIGGIVRDLNLLSEDPEYTWTVLSGPSTNVTISNSSALATSVVFVGDGIYTLSLNVVGNSTGAVASLEIMVIDLVPAVAAASPTNVPANEPTNTALESTSAAHSFAGFSDWSLSSCLLMAGLLVQVI